MNLASIATELYKNANCIEFGKLAEWDNTTFSVNWFKEKDRVVKDLPGLYWFKTNASFNQVKLQRERSRSGCDFLATSKSNFEAFSIDLQPRVEEDGFRVIYNGHRSQVRSRLRSHFSLRNDRTGALGIDHYDLSGNKWEAYYFTTADINSLKNFSESERDLILNLLNSKSGRIALENAWRAVYGWPELCKA